MGKSAIQNLADNKIRKLRSTVKGRAIAYSEAILILIRQHIDWPYEIWLNSN